MGNTAGLHRHQRGVALVVALLVVALAVVTAVAMVARQEVDIRRTANLLGRDQGWLYATGGEAWIRTILRRDRLDNDTDTLLEAWAQQIPPLPIDGGSMDGEIEDVQGRFNLNNLLSDKGVDALSLQRFKRLLTVLDIDPIVADAVIDWMDADQEVRLPDGAEDGDYLAAEPPYRTANARFSSAGELLLVKGFDLESWRRLAPHVIALPVRSAINVNTATLPVLQSLADNFSAADAEAIQVQQQQQGFDSVQSFLTTDAVAGLGIQPTGLSVDSGNFRARVTTRLGDRQTSVYSLLSRDKQGKVTVLMRSRSPD